MLEGISEKYIQVKIHAADWKEAVKKAAKPLLNDGAIEEPYVNAMIHTAQAGGMYIVIGRHIALAHARPELGAVRRAVGFTTLEPMVCFGVEAFDPVGLVITLSAKDANDHIGLMAKLAELLMDGEKVDQLIGADTAAEFFQLLKEGLELSDS